MRGVWAWSAMAVIATAALVSSHEDGPDLGEGAGVDDSAASQRGLVMKHVDVQALSIIDKYRGRNKKLISEEKSLRQQLDSPPEQLKGLSYTKIPGYKYGFEGRTIADKSRAECELVCSTYSACKSYSYNRQKRSCIWSMSHMHYDPDYTLHAKLLTPDGHFHTHRYTAVPGLAVQEDKKGEISDISFAECKYGCTEDESCKTFSFNKAKLECIRSMVPIHFADGWTYYEKDIPIDKPEKQGDKENDQKEKVKDEWIKASTRKTRKQIEKETKLVEQLSHARALAADAEKSEKAARREMNYNQRKCVLTSGMATNAVKRELRVMGIVSTRQLKTVQLQAYSEKMNKSVKQQTRKESLMKAKLDQKIALEKFIESEDKVHRIKRLEEEQKLMRKRSDERKVKSCEKDEQSQSMFAQRESHMKATEAEAKRMQNMKNFGHATSEYKSAIKDSTVKDTKERKSKKLVETFRVSVESAQKREEKSPEERDRKVAMDEKEAAKRHLKTASQNERGLHRSLMVAKEKTAKKKASRDDLKEVGVKGKKLVAKREKEIVEKSVERKKKKADEIREKGELKEQAKKKQEKVKELSEKHVAKQKAEVEKTQEKDDKDAESLKIVTRKKEQDTQRLDREQESGKKAEKKRQQELAVYTTQEKATKKKDAQDEIRTKNLLAELHATENKAADAKAAEGRRSAKALSDKVMATKIQHDFKNAKTEEQRLRLTSEEKTWKTREVTSSEKADKSTEGKASTALEQQKAAAGLRAESCIAVCMEGIQSRGKAKQQEKEMKVTAKMAELSAPQPIASPFQGQPPSEVRLGEGEVRNLDGEGEVRNLDGVSLIEMSEESDCGPDENMITGTKSGSCSGMITADAARGACALKTDACKSACESVVGEKQTKEGSCKASIPSEAQNAVFNAPKPSEDAPPISEIQKTLYRETETERKETKVKADQRKPVPEYIPEADHEPFTYKGCTC